MATYVPLDVPVPVLNSFAYLEVSPPSRRAHGTPSPAHAFVFPRARKHPLPLSYQALTAVHSSSSIRVETRNAQQGGNQVYDSCRENTVENSSGARRAFLRAYDTVPVCTATAAVRRYTAARSVRCATALTLMRWRADVNRII